jgi:hypothetical protein
VTPVKLVKLQYENLRKHRLPFIILPSWRSGFDQKNTGKSNKLIRKYQKSRQFSEIRTNLEELAL